MALYNISYYFNITFTSSYFVCSVAVPPWPKSVTWYNSGGRVEDADSPGADVTGACRYRKMADGLGGFLLEVKPTEAVDQGDWKCVATSEEGVIAISSSAIEMSSKYQENI